MLNRVQSLFLGLWIALVVSSCITNKKVVYVQKNDVNQKGLPKDTVVRTYNPEPFDYKVQSNDALYIRFESLTPDEYDFFQEASAVGGAGGGRNFAVASELVDPEGKILFPVVGKVKVAGMTVFQIQDSLQIIANRYLESPVVKVRLVNFRFTVLGEVGAEGTVITFNNRVSVLEAIGLAGGIGELADRANVKIIRQREGKTEVGYVNLLDENLISSPFYYVTQNDVLVVPPLRQRPFRKYFGQNFSIIISSVSLLLLVVNLTNN
jgi:polysaccharide export outer membrane protein